MLLCRFFHATSPTKIYTLSLHDALPISSTNLQDGALLSLEVLAPPPIPLGGLQVLQVLGHYQGGATVNVSPFATITIGDRKSTRLNSSHANISYAVFCLKKKKVQRHTPL